MQYKMCIVVREDVPMSPGKLAVQVAHACVGCAQNTDLCVQDWFNEGQKKIVLKVKDLESLIKVKSKADSLNVYTYLVEDFGLTEIPSGTVTCVGIGPATDVELKPITGRLKLW